jgi:hypothetical protein
MHYSYFAPEPTSRRIMIHLSFILLYWAASRIEMINISDIKNRNFNPCIVSMGRIRLPLAVSYALEGVRVFGVEKREETLQILKNNKISFYETGM